MAEKVEIEFLIGPDGEVHLETHGLKGESCLDETKDVERALGRVRARAKTGEYWQQRGTATQVTRRRP